MAACSIPDIGGLDRCLRTMNKTICALNLADEQNAAYPAWKIVFFTLATVALALVLFGNYILPAGDSVSGARSKIGDTFKPYSHFNPTLEVPRKAK